MIKTIKKMQIESNIKRKELTAENLAYYESFLLYVRSFILKDERATEEVLMEMLDHLLLAQKDGKSAEDVFGKEPEQLAQEVANNLPMEPFKYVFTFTLEIIATLVAFYTIINGIFDIILKNETTFYLGNSLIVLALFVGVLAILILVVFKQIRKDAFNQKSFSKKFIISYALILFGASIGIWLLHSKLPNVGREIEVGTYGLFSIGCLLMLITFVMKKIREQR